MNAILRTSVAVWSIVFIATTLPASLVSATPLRFQIDMVMRPDGAGTSLANATMKLDLTWDAWTIAPLFPAGGAWPTSNTTGSLTVSGSAAVDGVYSPQFPSSMSQWLVVDGAASVDSIRLPSMRFAIGGQTFDFDSFRVDFENTFFERIPLSPLYPKPFESTEAQWDLRDVITILGPKLSSAQPLSISARYVPEPSTLATASFAFLSLAVLRRRK